MRNRTVLLNVRLARFTLMFLGLFLMALGSTQAKPVVRPGDSVNVVCEEEPSLSKDYTITRDGYIVMQFIGAVAVAGLDEPTASAKLAATLIEQRILPRAHIKLKIVGTKTALISYAGAVGKSGDIYPRPGLRLSDVVTVAQPTGAANLERVRITTADGKELGVNFKAFDGKDQTHNPELRAGDRVFFDLVSRPLDVTVTGMVVKPGTVAFNEGMTLRQAVAAAGGPNATADKSVRLERAGQVKEYDISKEDAGLQAGDRIFVPQQQVLTYVQVEGAVMTPRRVPFRDGITLSEAVDAAGGAFAKADLGKVQVVRKVDGKDKIITHDLAAVYASKAGDFELRANDRVNVPMPSQKRAGRTNQALKIIGGLVLGAMFGFLRF